MPDDERTRRITQNEQLFAAVNEAIRHVDESLDVGDESEHYVCECSVQECSERIPLTRDEYTEARDVPGRFFMVAAHRDPAHERIVRTTDRYVLVEKTE